MDRKLTSFSPAGAVITAILASVCCVGPLVLVILGVSGAWIGGLRANMVIEVPPDIFILDYE